MALHRSLCTRRVAPQSPVIGSFRFLQSLRGFPAALLCLILAIASCRAITAYSVQRAGGCDPALADLKPSAANSVFRFASVNYNPGNRRWKLANSVNWTANARQRNLLRIKNEGSCQSSWAMAPVTAVEMGYAALRNDKGYGSSDDDDDDDDDDNDDDDSGGGSPSPSTGSESPRYLSVEQVLDCVDGKKSNCSGGWPSYALDLMQKKTKQYGGLVAADKYPYTGDDGGKCDKTKSRLSATSIGISAFERIDYYGWLGLLLAVQVQPAVAFLHTALPSFQNYKSGIFRDPACARGVVDNSVTVVGYSFSPTPIWIIRNSWGDGWGMKGYMHLAMLGGAGACNIHSVPSLVPVIASSSPCALRINPCGGGTCEARGDSSSGKYKCKCPKRFVKVKNRDGTEACAPVVVCTRSDISPCALGTCLNDNKGGYKCLCPHGFKQGSVSQGGQTCVPTDKPVTKVKVPVTTRMRTVYNLYGLTRKAFLKLNPQLSSSALVIPKGSRVAVDIRRAAVRCGVFFTWIGGSSCRSISLLFGLSVPLLQQLNPGLSCTTGALPGEQVCVQSGQSPACRPLCAQWHTINPPDSCNAIRRRYRLQPLALFRLNPGLMCANLYPAASVDGLTAIPSGAQICVKDAGNVTTSTLGAPANVPLEGRQLQQRRGSRCLTTYRVVQGDFCSRIIATRFRYSSKRMADFNNGYVCTNARLYVGLVLCTRR